MMVMVPGTVVVAMVAGTAGMKISLRLMCEAQALRKVRCVLPHQGDSVPLSHSTRPCFVHVLGLLRE